MESDEPETWTENRSIQFAKHLHQPRDRWLVSFLVLHHIAAVIDQFECIVTRYSIGVSTVDNELLLFALS